MELIKRYVYAVGRRVAGNQREDIEKELESSIYDALEDKFGKKDQYTAEEAKTVLKQLGPPWEVAKGYARNAGCIVGPELYITYMMVVKIVAGATALGLLISFIVGLFTPELSVARFFLDILQLIPRLLMGVITGIGFVTVIFYLIERNVPEYQLKGLTKDHKWKPEDLPEVPEGKEKISVSESIMGIIFTIVFIILFNFFSEKLGIYYTPNWGEKFRFVQIFSQQAISTYLPFWSISWIISLVFHIFCLIQRVWSIKTRAFDLLTNVISTGILIMMIKGPEIVDIRVLLDNSKPEVADVLTPLAEFIKYSLDGILIFVLVAVIIAVVVKTVKLFISIGKQT